MTQRARLRLGNPIARSPKVYRYLTLILSCMFMAWPAFSANPSSKAAANKNSKTTQGNQPVRLKIDVPCRAWTPKGMPKLVLLCVHGLGLNSNSYEGFGKTMSQLGIAVFAVDVRGFGTWMKLEGKEELDFDGCLSDVEQALKTLHKAYPSLHIYILGESMGGAIALRVMA